MELGKRFPVLSDKKLAHTLIKEKMSAADNAKFNSLNKYAKYSKK